MNTPIDHFIDGQRDCRDGLPAKSHDKSYQSGYAFQYEMEQRLTHQSEQREKRK